jgi:hypothetical protein
MAARGVRGVGDETAEQVEEALAELAADASAATWCVAALAAQGGVLVAQTYDEAAAFASRLRRRAPAARHRQRPSRRWCSPGSATPAPSSSARRARWPTATT